MVMLACIMAVSSCDLRSTSYYHASFIPPSDLELEMGLRQPHGMEVKPTASYPDDSAAVTSERQKVIRMAQLVEGKENAAQGANITTMRDSIRLATESKVHKQILSEKHIVIAIDDASKENADALFHKIELFGFDSQEVSDFIKKSRLAIRFYPLN